MPRHCSIKGCKSNYYKTPPVTTFTLPKDEDLKNKWLSIIPNDFSKIKSPAVCIKHFNENDIVKIDRCLVRGEYKEYPRKIPKLKENAVPCIFPIICVKPKKCNVFSGRHTKSSKRLKVNEEPTNENVSLKETATPTNNMNNIEVTIKREPLDEFENMIESGPEKEQCRTEDSSASPKKMKSIPAKHEYIEHKVDKREAIFGLFVASEMSTLCDNPLLYTKTKEVILKTLSEAQLEHLNSNLS